MAPEFPRSKHTNLFLFTSSRTGLDGVDGWIEKVIDNLKTPHVPIFDGGDHVGDDELPGDVAEEDFGLSAGHRKCS